jgi:selenide,water dikinase
MTIETEHVPLMREALAMYERGVKTGANLGNREMVQQRTLFANVAPWKLEIWFDPQTSGGLLAALPAEQAEEAVAALATAGVTQARRIGAVAPFDGSYSLIFA